MHTSAWLAKKYRLLILCVDLEKALWEIRLQAEGAPAVQHTAL